MNDLPSGILDTRSAPCHPGLGGPSGTHDSDTLRADPSGTRVHPGGVRDGSANPSGTSSGIASDYGSRGRATSQGRGVLKAVALYARVSSEQQAQQATVESQIAMLKERAVAEGHAILPSGLQRCDAREAGA